MISAPCHVFLLVVYRDSQVPWIVPELPPPPDSPVHHGGQIPGKSQQELSKQTINRARKDIALSEDNSRGGGVFHLRVLKQVLNVRIFIFTEKMFLCCLFGFFVSIKLSMNFAFCKYSFTCCCCFLFFLFKVVLFLSVECFYFCNYMACLPTLKNSFINSSNLQTYVVHNFLYHERCSLFAVLF